MAMLFVIPFAAFAEELYFRAWLTQTIGRYIRSTTTVVVLVAVLFAAFHTQYDLRLKTLIFVNSLGLSALSLRDQRLELAIGAHSMANACVALNLPFFTGPFPRAQIPATLLDFWTLIALKGVLPFALMYGLLQDGSSRPTLAALFRATFSQNIDEIADIYPMGCAMSDIPARTRSSWKKENT
jgi:uncharacterized protein